MGDADIDRLVAIHVMKWRPDDNCPRGYRPCWSINVGKNDGPDYDDWTPSTDIACAWQALGRFPYGEWAIILGNQDNGWLCKIYGLSKDMDYSQADTAPMAICLAALKAVGVANLVL
jgi:hypothetical protein